MKGDKSSADLTGFQKTHQRRQSRRIYQEYREKYRPRVFKIAILLLAITLSISAVVLTSARGSTVPKSPSIISTSNLLAPTMIDDLRGQKLVALTFDDGPSPYSEAILDILKKEKVTATFFVMGMKINQYRATVQREYREGNQVASHATNHKNLARLSPPARQAEMNYTAALIEQTIGVRPSVLRPPYGEWNGNVLGDSSVPLVLWSVDPRDWEYRNVDWIYQNVMSNVRDGSIILLHDVYPESVEAVAKIVPALKAQGYALVTVNRLMMARGASFEPGHYYRYLYP